MPEPVEIPTSEVNRTYTRLAYGALRTAGVHYERNTLPSGGEGKVFIGKSDDGTTPFVMNSLNPVGGSIIPEYLWYFTDITNPAAAELIFLFAVKERDVVTIGSDDVLKATVSNPSGFGTVFSLGRRSQN